MKKMIKRKNGQTMVEYIIIVVVIAIAGLVLFGLFVASPGEMTYLPGRDRLPLAFLAPDITRDILAGKQPIGLTSTWIMTHRLPISWDDQRALIATL